MKDASHGRIELADEISSYGNASLKEMQEKTKLALLRFDDAIRELERQKEKFQETVDRMGKLAEALDTYRKREMKAVDQMLVDMEKELK